MERYYIYWQDHHGRRRNVSYQYDIVLGLVYPMGVAEIGCSFLGTSYKISIYLLHMKFVYILISVNEIGLSSIHTCTD